MKTAFLFPGQGAQTVGMGLDLYDNNNIYKQTFDSCVEGAGLDLKAACFEGWRMDESEVVQPAIFAHSVSLLACLRNEGIDAGVYAGLSLGEYTALTAAKVFGTGQCAALLRERGRLMDNALPKGEGGMLSVIGFNIEQVAEGIKGFKDVYIANHLSELQTAVSGLMPELNALKEKFDSEGAKMTSMLSVRGPFHSPFLKETSEEFLKNFEKIEISEAQGTVYSNATGLPYEEGSEVKKLLVKQMCSLVKWHDCVENMITSGIGRYVEVGPSNVLSKMLKRRVDKSVSVESVKDLAGLQKFLSDNK